MSEIVHPPNPREITPYGELFGGGSPAQSYVPEELPDSLRSEATVELLLLIGEGVISGYAREVERSVFLDNTAVRRFKGCQYAIRRGLLDQAPLRNYSLAAQESPVGVQVRHKRPIVQTIEDPDTDAVRLRFSFSAMIKYEDDGDIKGSSVEFQVETANNGEGFKVRRRRTIEGKASGQFQFDMQIRLAKGKHPWRIRVSRLTKDSESNKEMNDFFWQAVTKIVLNRFTYPRSALFAIRFRAEYFNAIPSVGLLLEGLVIRVPSNYDPVSRTYDGLWNGTFKTAYSNNPAWCLYDLLTDRLYGAGEYLGEDKIDKWTLYSIGQYCDERVPKPGGGVEPRFTFNAYIQNREDAHQVIGAMLSVFRGMMYEAEQGFLYTVCNQPKTPVRIYTEANVIQEVDEQGNVAKAPFNYASTSPKVRHTVALVSYLDQTDRYRRKIAYVQDVPGIQRYGYRETEITAFGCTSKGQANRLGRWTLLSEQLETATVTFTVGDDGMLVRPGEVIAIADPTVAGVRVGGRVRSWNGATGQVTVDQIYGFNAFSRIVLLKSDGKVQDVPVLNGSGTSNVISVGPLADPPAPETPYIYYYDGSLEPQQFLVQSIKENEDGTYEITAIEYNPSKFNAVDFDSPTYEIPVSVIPNPLTPPPPPKDITFTESLYTEGNNVQNKISLTWSQDPYFFPCTFQVRYKWTNTLPSLSSVTQAGYDDLSRRVNQAFAVADWVQPAPFSSKAFEILRAREGHYYFEFYAINPYGVRSGAATLYSYSYGRLAPPAAPTNFRSRGLALGANMIGLAWDPSPDLDVRFGGSFELRWSPLFLNLWNQGQLIGFYSGQTTSVDVAMRSGTYMLKAVDSSGIRSIGTAFLQNDVSRITNTNFIFTDPINFAVGTATGLRINRAADRSLFLTLADDSLFDQRPGNFDDLEGLFDDADSTFDSLQNNITSYSDILWDRLIVNQLVPQGIYEHPTIYDVGDVFECKVEGIMETESFIERKNLFDFSVLFDDIPGTFDGDNAPNATAEMQVATSVNMTDWSPWIKLETQTIAARGFKFRIVLSSTSPEYNVRVSNGRVTVDMPERFESGVGVTPAAPGGRLVVFPMRGFYAPPEFSVTISNMAVNDVHSITGLNTRSVVVTTTNAGSPVSRNFTWIARGYGRSVFQ